jgi:cell division protein FtsB
LDVHPPHEPIRSWRDFLLHLATITIGLLIAVALEAGVEELHYRHIVAAARANLRREITENHATYAQNLQSLEADQERLKHDIDQLRDIRAGKPPEHIDMHWSFDWSSYVDSAWQSARDIGAIAHMRPDAIEVYSEIYNQQRYVNDMGAGILADEAKAAAPLLFAKDGADPRDLTPGDIQAMLLASAELSARIVTLEPLMKTLDDDYAALLKEP